MKSIPTLQLTCIFLRPKQICTVLPLLLGAFLYFATPVVLLAQAGSPCNAHRWEEGAHWTGSGCGVNDGNNAPDPLGIIRCGNSADTESGIDDNTTYDPDVFTITPGSCIDPN